MVPRKRRARATTQPSSPALIWLRRVRTVVLVVVVVPAVAVGGYGYWIMDSSRAALTGTKPLAGLSNQVEVLRDKDGVPTLTAANRTDLARALGYVHAQERFFQMDLLRRAGAGELSELLGPATLKVDRARRIHRFRARAQAMLTGLTPEERDLLQAYTDGVNAGLAALGHTPWEYTLLRTPPLPWRLEDAALVTFALYFDLQSADASDQIAAAAEQSALGPALANFLYPKGSTEDAAVDNTYLPEPPIPDGTSKQGANTLPLAPTALREAVPGSNNFAVSGKLTSTGAAMIENDMHLDIRVPHIWFRARQRIPGQLDMTGVTLPGTPAMIAGTNTHIAWGFTDSFIETGDAVIVEPADPDNKTYKTPDGAKPYQIYRERICAAHADCETLTIRETIWGPITNRDPDGHDVAWRWLAHDANAVRLAGLLGLERAHNVTEAIAAARTAGMPDQNLMVGDTDGHIAWTIIGQIPRRRNLTDQLPHSWADNSHGWDGYLSPDEIPAVIDPPAGRLWSANARVVGGQAYAVLGDGFYASPVRAHAIRDDLAARSHFAEQDLLDIANDTRAHELDPWQALLLAAITANSGNDKFVAMRPYVANWGGRAVPDSVGYRLVRQFRGDLLRRIYGGLAEPVAAKLGTRVPIPEEANAVALRLLAARPAKLIPKPATSWDEVIHAGLASLTVDIDREAGGDINKFTWGARNHTAIHHPVAAAVPLLGLLTDPPDVPVAGDTEVPRVAIQGFGASERMVISPGHEEQALFHMPVGQAGNPLAPYYGAGEDAWVRGLATPLLPGAARWSLVLSP